MATHYSIINAVKVWVFPGLISVLAGSIWHDLKEVKSDVKKLMIQSGVDNTRIDNLERRVSNLETTIYLKITPSMQSTSMIIPLPSKLFKKEDEFDIKKYLKRRA